MDRSLGEHQERVFTCVANLSARREPDKVSPAIAWVLGSEAAYVTGAVIRVAGGI